MSGPTPALITPNNQPKMSFARVAASANARANQISSPKNVVSPTQQTQTTPASNASVIRPRDKPTVTTPPNLDAEKFTPRPSKIIPAIPNNLPIYSTYKPVPVSEENVTKIPSFGMDAKENSMDSKSTTSRMTFQIDEKESLRPDDSASIMAIEEDDGPISTRQSSQTGSDTNARAFSEQLREIAVIDPHSRSQPHLIMSNSNPVNRTLYNPLPVLVPRVMNELSPNLTCDTNGLVVGPDEKLLEALNSIRDRVWVLKLEQDITDFVKDATANTFDLPQCNSFYRMLAHKMADYYFLGHTMDGSVSAVRLWKTANCRIPPRLSDFGDASTTGSTPPPAALQMKILRRNGQGQFIGSRDGSLDGEGNSDVGKGKLPVTREEREARYEAARLRILGSAKPDEEDQTSFAAEKVISNPSSALGQKKTKTPRVDSDDGFEARSAYSMYNHDGLRRDLQNENVPYGGVSNHSYNVNYGQYPEQVYNNQSWYNAGIPQQPVMPFNGYSDMNLAGQMQSLSFQPNQMSSPTSRHHLQQSYQGYTISPQHIGYSQQQQQVITPNQSYGYYQQPYNYSSNNSSDSLQQNRLYFNPQSQAFIPGQQSSSPPAFVRPSFSKVNSPHINGYSTAFAQPGQFQVSRQPQHIIPPDPNTLNHPLPLPVFSQAYFKQDDQLNDSNQTQSEIENNVEKEAESKVKESVKNPATNLIHTESPTGLAKYAPMSSLPAKPPPPIQ